MSEFQTIYELISLICLITLNIIEIYKYYIKYKANKLKNEQPKINSNISQLGPQNITQISTAQLPTPGPTFHSSVTPYALHNFNT